MSASVCLCYLNKVHNRIKTNQNKRSNLKAC